MKALVVRVAVLLVVAGCGRIGFDPSATGASDAMPACTPALAITALHSGERYACAQRADGTLGCWGAGGMGQLGTGAPEASPVLVSPRDLGAVSTFATGATHACAVTAGALSCWGSNRTGELGQGDTTERDAPALVASVPANVQAVAAGGMNTCALESNGDLYCWGQTDGTVLGTNTQPRKVVGIPPVRAVALSSGRLISSSEHGCAIATDGTVWCWGDGDDGELGTGGVANSATPVQAQLPVSADALALGTGYTCALAAGDVYCWGANDRGQLGLGTRSSTSAPMKVALSGVDEIAAFGETTCARTATDVYCWGDNSRGQLGGAATTDLATSPVRIDVPPARAIAVGASRSCALDAAGVLRCWGAAELDVRGPAVSSLPGPYGGGIVAAGDRTCAIAGDTSIACWGGNASGEIGDGTQIDRAVPVVVDHGVGIATGRHTACAVHADGSVACWGQNDTKQIDLNAPGLVLQPRTLTLPKSMQAIATGSIHTCGIDVGNVVWCWGSDSEGELALANTMPAFPPTQTTFAASKAIAAGDLHTCTIQTSGQLECAGRNNELQIVAGMNDVYTPVAIAGLTDTSQVSLGGMHTCAVAGGLAYCWGDGTAGQLGNNSRGDVGAPALLPLTNVVEIAAGGAHTCARDASGTVSCWGANDDGQLGDGSRRASTIPITATALAGAVRLAAGANHTCALFADGSVKCVGSRTRGQLGDGTPPVPLTPALSPITCP